MLIYLSPLSPSPPDFLSKLSVEGKEGKEGWPLELDNVIKRGSNPDRISTSTYHETIKSQTQILTLTQGKETDGRKLTGESKHKTNSLLHSPPILKSLIFNTLPTKSLKGHQVFHSTFQSERKKIEVENFGLVY